MEKQMIKLEYEKYLKTTIYEETKNRFNKSKYNKNKCYICGKTNVSLELHHKTYERIGKERLTDLVQLCHLCHEQIHIVLKQCYTNRFTLWNVAFKCRKLFKKCGQMMFNDLIKTDVRPIKKHKDEKVRFIKNTEGDIRITSKLLMLGISCKGGWSMKQLSLLGITKLYKGWKKQLVGTKFPQSVINQFIELKDKHINLDREDLKKKKRTKEKHIHNYEKAYKELCYFEKASKKKVKLRKKSDAGWSSLVAHRVHTSEIAGSNPAPATMNRKLLKCT